MSGDPLQARWIVNVHLASIAQALKVVERCDEQEATLNARAARELGYRVSGVLRT